MSWSPRRPTTAPSISSRRPRARSATPRSTPAARRSGWIGGPQPSCAMVCVKPLRAFGNGHDMRRRPPVPRQPEPKPDQVADRPQDRYEAGTRPNAGHPRVMIHGNLLNAKPAALALEVQLGVEQCRSRQQGRRGFEHLAPHQLETAVNVTDPHAVQGTDQDVEDASDNQPVARVGAAPSPAG